MTELEKLETPLEYSFWDEEVNVRKQHAIKETAELNVIDPHDKESISEGLNNNCRLRQDVAVENSQYPKLHQMLRISLQLIRNIYYTENSDGFK